MVKMTNEQRFNEDMKSHKVSIFQNNKNTKIMKKKKVKTGKMTNEQCFNENMKSHRVPIFQNNEERKSKNGQNDQSTTFQRRYEKSYRVAIFQNNKNSKIMKKEKVKMVKMTTSGVLVLRSFTKTV